MPKTSKTKGFTLIELLVVVAIIAILAVVSLALFGNVQKAARDGVRRSNIDTLAKNLETRFDYGSSLYQQLDPNDFSEGLIPKDPDGSSYNGVPQSATSSFQLCAALDNHPLRSCNSPSQTCFCKSSMRGDLASIGVYNGTFHPVSCDPNGTLDDGLVGYWKMDESSWNGTSGEVKDFSGYGIGGTAVSGANTILRTPAQTNNTRTGTFSDNTYVTLGNYQFDTLTNATMSLWFYYTGSFDTNRLLFNRHINGAADSRQPIFVSYPGGYSNKLVFENIVNGSNRSVVSDNAISPNTWYHAVFVCGSVGMRMYLNGVQQVSTNSTTDCLVTISPTSATTLGGGGGTSFAGQIDDLRVYNRALSPQEISSLWSSGLGCLP